MNNIAPHDSDEAYEWAQRARDRRLEKLERERTASEFDWDPDEEDILDPDEEYGSDNRG